MTDLTQFHHTDKHGNPTSVYDFRIFEYLSEKGNMFILGQVPYFYKDGVYTADLNGSQLKTEIRKLIYPEFIRSNTIDRIFRLFIQAEELQKKTSDLNQYPSHWINFRNGFYDPKEKILLPHSPSYMSVNQIPHTFNPAESLTGKNIDEWLNFITPDPNDKEMLLQFCGYCMTCDTRQQKFMILTGGGGSGKSTVIRLLEKVIGTDNISNISLKELSQKFASFGLLGKLLNSCADLEVSALEDTSVLKKVLGEDSIRAEAKGKDAISFKSYAKLIFSTNELPMVLNEKTNGFYRRLLILPMNNQPVKILPDFIDTLETEYFIQLSVKALERMYEAGVIFESDHSEEAVTQLRNDSDTVEAWLSENMVRDPSGRLERSFLFNNYENFCSRNDRTALKRNTFFRSMRMKGFSEVKSMGAWYFKGISDKKSSLKNALKGSSLFPEITDDEELPY